MQYHCNLKDDESVAAFNEFFVRKTVGLLTFYMKILFKLDEK